MGTLNDIRQKLLSGYSTSQLIVEGYAKSSVNHVARNLKKNQEPGATVTQVDDELQGLRHQKEKIKLQKEIAELEDDKEKLPDRVEKLEVDIQELKDTLFDLWVKQALEAIRELSCSAHGHTMGMVMKCKECNYEMGLGWRT